jgi:hypothetical protein
MNEESCFISKKVSVVFSTEIANELGTDSHCFWTATERLFLKAKKNGFAWPTICSYFG